MDSKYIFKENAIFHVYNRTNNKEFLFRAEENKSYFLNQYSKFITPFVDTFSWTLLDTHFHLLLRVKKATNIQNFLASQKRQYLTKTEKEFLENNKNLDYLVTSIWQRFFTSYAMAFNKMYNRSGNLFHRPFNRIEVKKETHFTQSIIYIHKNIEHHNLHKDFRQYKWSSYHSILSDKPTLLKRDEVLNWFGGVEPFIRAHDGETKYYDGFFLDFDN